MKKTILTIVAAFAALALYADSVSTATLPAPVMPTRLAPVIVTGQTNALAAYNQIVSDGFVLVSGSQVSARPSRPVLVVSGSNAGSFEIDLFQTPGRH